MCSAMYAFGGYSAGDEDAIAYLDGTLRDAWEKNWSFRETWSLGTNKRGTGLNVRWSPSHVVTSSTGSLADVTFEMAGNGRA